MQLSAAIPCLAAYSNLPGYIPRTRSFFAHSDSRYLSCWRHIGALHQHRKLLWQFAVPQRQLLRRGCAAGSLNVTCRRYAAEHINYVISPSGDCMDRSCRRQDYRNNIPTIRLWHKYEDLPKAAKSDRLMADRIRHTNMAMDLAVLLHVVLKRIPRRTVQKFHRNLLCPHWGALPGFYAIQNVRGNV
jgi:hypothetical protein